MSNQVEQTDAKNTPATNEASTEIIEIDLGNLSDTQKIALLSVVGSFVLQIIYLLELKVVTGILKNFIPSDYQVLTDFVRKFVGTFTPYLIVFFFMIGLYIAYQMLLNSKENLEMGSQLFDYVGIVILLLIALFFISLVSIPNKPFTSTGINQTFPTIVELFLFLIVIALTVEIALAPFYVQKYFSLQKTKSVPAVAQSKNE